MNFDDVAPGFIFDAAFYSTIEKFNLDVRSATRGAQIFGGDGDDRITSSETFREGFSGHDTYDGRGGNADTFICDKESAQSQDLDRITDFGVDSGDVLPFRGVDNIANFESFIAASVDIPEGIFVGIDGTANGIIIETVTLAELTENDVSFA
ncbi:hypothetical protein [Brucella intermedia]|uniref:hypothetical protein n=1 Tax=Brucella intermedia TaxID=94625 RepID=UPI00178C21D6|nr:hypothetical protein [Brucella intermedia]